MSQADFYQVLGVESDASVSKIKEAYRQLAFKYHPDRNRGDSVAADRMKKINEAYAVLSNPSKKAEYDQLRSQFGSSAYSRFKNTYTEQDIFSGSDINHIFEEMARSFGFRGSSEIFREFYGKGYQRFEFKNAEGTTRQFVFQSGSRPGFKLHGQGPLSGNLGKLIRFVLQKAGGIQLPEDGADIDEHLYLAPQQALQGGPYAYYLRRQAKKLVVKIPPGIREGQRIRLAGMGEKGKSGGRPGDLFLRVHIRKPLLKSIRDFFTGRKGAT
ncbi:MAG: DnaJ domain-containing protein [Desulfobacterales bacterium]|nr:DnaJ domain-containing protein [Desulfobacterales bacterium]